METNEPVRRSVLLLGAGASRGSRFGLPTLQGLFDGARKGSHLFDALSVYFGTDDITQWDIEMVLSHLAINASLPRGWPEYLRNQYRDSGVPLFDEIVAYVVQRLAVPRSEVCDVHRELFTRLGPETTIVTLNYDLVADQALQKVETDRGTAPINNRYGRLLDILQPSRATYGGQQTPGRLGPSSKYAEFLKLHGSLDWFHCPNQACARHKVAFPQNFYQSQMLANMTCLDCGLPLQVMLIPPASTKDFNDGGTMSRIWRIALEEFTIAQRWIVAGTSLSATDQHVRWLLKTAIQHRESFKREVVIVNPCREDRENIMRLLQSGQVAFSEHSSLKSFVDAL